MQSVWLITVAIFSIFTLLGVSVETATAQRAWEEDSQRTQGGARAVQQSETLGTLEVGKKADLIVIDTQRAHLVPAGRILSAVVHSGHPGDIESVMVNGAFVMRDHRVLTMDEDAIIQEADAVGRRIWQDVLEQGTVTVPRLPRGS